MIDIYTFFDSTSNESQDIFCGRYGWYHSVPWNVETG